MPLHVCRQLLMMPTQATFRTLATSQYPKKSVAGPGIIVTVSPRPPKLPLLLLTLWEQGKGFPDLATRRFLSVIHSVRPHLRFYGLVDFDPHGIAILRTYKGGSKRLGHEQNTTVPNMTWLGIHSSDVLSASRRENLDVSRGSDSPSSQDISSQESVAYSHGGNSSSLQARVSMRTYRLTPHSGSQVDHQSKRQKIRDSRDPVESFLPLTEPDRKTAVDLMNDICSADVVVHGDNLEQLGELQRMMMLNVKAEIQAVDDFGNIARWLDERLPSS